MRVAQIIETLAMGGAENLAVHIANHLAAAGHDSHLIVITHPDVLSEKILPQVKVHYLGFERASIRNPFRFLVSLYRGQRLLAGLVVRQKIALVQTHLPGSNFWGLILAWRRKCAVFATIHNNEEFRYGDLDNPFLAFLRKKAYQQILRRCQGVIAVSAEVRASLVRALKASPKEAAKVSVVTNAVAVPSPLAAGERARIRSDLGVPVDVPFLLAAGRFCEQKNFGDLLTAAGLLKARRCAFHLVIAGEGEERPALLARTIAEDLDSIVSLPGNLTDLRSVMQAADVFVMSSLWEGLPLVLLEAMATGLPVIAYGIAGIEEVVAHRESGLTVATGEPAALADGLAEVLEDGALREAMGSAGLRRISTDFNFETLMARLAGLYDSALPDPEKGEGPACG